MLGCPAQEMDAAFAAHGGGDGGPSAKGLRPRGIIIFSVHAKNWLTGPPGIGMLFI
jgi:hypothetical protein